MIPSDFALARLQQDSYTDTPAGEIIDVGPDRIVLTRQPSLLIITVRGTHNQPGWFSDFQIAPKVAREHPQLGVCEDGFLTGAEALWAVLRLRIDPASDVKTIGQGHSRGAPIIAIIAGLAALEGIFFTRVVCWEKPWGNGAKLRTLLDNWKIDGIEYWHGDDPVPLVPAVTWLVMANFPIKHFGKWCANPFDCHGIAGIIADLPMDTPSTAP